MSQYKISTASVFKNNNNGISTVPCVTPVAPGGTCVLALIIYDMPYRHTRFFFSTRGFLPKVHGLLWHEAASSISLGLSGSHWHNTWEHCGYHQLQLCYIYMHIYIYILVFMYFVGNKVTTSTPLTFDTSPKYPNGTSLFLVVGIQGSFTWTGVIIRLLKCQWDCPEAYANPRDRTSTHGTGLVMIVCGYVWEPLLLTWGNFIIPAWISNHIHCKLCDRITYPFPNFNGCTVEVWEGISNFIPHFTGYLITYPCWH